MEKIILFDGTNLDKWESINGGPAEWDVHDGILTIIPGKDSIITKEKFEDALIHVEFMCPGDPEAVEQDRSNSGVYVQGCYEIQVLDSYGILPVKKRDCGSIYSIHAPLENACTPPGTWQTYDIVFRAAQFDEEGNVTDRARLTVFQNGIVIHNNLSIRTTAGGLSREIPKEGPLYLQDNGCVAHFRNIWIAKLEPKDQAPPKVKAPQN